MIESVNIALKFPEERIPALPGLENDTQVRAVIALHLEKTLFCEGDEDLYKSHIENIFDDLNIVAQETKDTIIGILETYQGFLETLVSHLHAQGVQKIKEEGTFSYELGKHAYFDNDEYKWKLDIEGLQKGEADYDSIDLSAGQTVFIFNPTVKRDARIIVHSGDLPVRTSVSGAYQGAQVSKLQAHLLANSQCTCNVTPCTCGASIAAAPLDDEDGTEENPFEQWDKLMMDATDRDIILVFNDGEEVMRL